MIGETLRLPPGAIATGSLQWSPDLMIGETATGKDALLAILPASMEPRPDDRGNRVLGITRGRECAWASMEPRPDDRGNIHHPAMLCAGIVASMEPRPDDRGNRARRLGGVRAAACFNGAPT